MAAGTTFATGTSAKTEVDPLDPQPVKGSVQTARAIVEQEAMMAEANDIETVVLRYGNFYGPGTSISTDNGGFTLEAIRRRRFPIVGRGTGVWSFTHIDDVAGSTVIAGRGDATGRLQHRRRRASARRGVDAVSVPGDRRETTPPTAAMGGLAGWRAAAGVDDGIHPRRRQHQSQTRPGLGAAMGNLARRLQLRAHRQLAAPDRQRRRTDRCAAPMTRDGPTTNPQTRPTPTGSIP